MQGTAENSSQYPVGGLRPHRTRSCNHLSAVNDKAKAEAGRYWLAFNNRYVAVNDPKRRGGTLPSRLCSRIVLDQLRLE
jgi:hypothetical protein